MTNNLSENSKAYYQNVDAYQLFSQAEDYPNKILPNLIRLTKGKTVVDVGCGNGKYCHLLKETVQSIIGIDKSYEQLKLAKNLNNMRSNLSGNLFIQGDATLLPMPDNSTDIALACWMLGTIVDQTRQIQALNEMKRITNEKIILIENQVGSEFESLRGRFPDALERTQKYNNWLIEQGFQLQEVVSTYFQFHNVDTAQHTFRAIWGNKLIRPITNKKIEHQVAVFVWEK